MIEQIWYCDARKSFHTYRIYSVPLSGAYGDFLDWMQTTFHSRFIAYRGKDGSGVIHCFSETDRDHLQKQVDKFNLYGPACFLNEKF